MNVFNNINNLPAFQNAIITIGSFDGVHCGHLQIIRQMQEEAAKINGTPVVITFFPHPKMVVGNESGKVMILNTLDEKISLLEKAGIENLVVVPFTAEFAAMSAEEYVSKFLVECFHPHTIIIGYDHRFGKNRTGDFQLLETHSSMNGYSVKEIPEHVIDDITISSTKIRNQLLEGNIESANELLGYQYFFSGTVVKGNQLGRTIGFPTANIQPNDIGKLIPGNGVYAVDVEIEKNPDVLKGMMNIGIRPTLDLHQRVIEVNILNFSDTIYEKQVTVRLKRKLRDEMKFESLDLLKEQLKKDKAIAETI